MTMRQNAINSGNGMARNRGQAITWTSADPVHRGTYAAPGEDGLIHLESVHSILKQILCYKV